MCPKRLDRKPQILGLALAFAGLIYVSSPAAGGEKPYQVVDGKVDFGTYNGYRRYHNRCHACHGFGGVGSSFGPSLIDSLKRIDKDEFYSVVVAGRITDIGGGARNVMPSFAGDPNVMEHMVDIYAYVKARSDGVIGPGRPPHLPKKKE